MCCLSALVIGGLLLLINFALDPLLGGDGVDSRKINDKVKVVKVDGVRETGYDATAVLGESDKSTKDKQQVGSNSGGSLIGLFSSAAGESSISFQGKIVRNGVGVAGLNPTDLDTSCIVAGADTCDFKVEYTDSTGATVYGSEFFADIEIGEYDGIFTLVLGGGDAFIAGYTAPADVSEIFEENTSVSVRVSFDPTGTASASPPISATYTEVFGLMAARSAPFAIRAKTLEGLGADRFVQFSPISIQTASTFLGLIRLNQDGSGGLLQLQVSGADEFVVGNTGLITTESVDSASIVDGSIAFVDWASNGCSADQVPLYNGSAWVCSSTSSLYTASNGLTLTGTDFELGGVLTQDTEITQGGFDMSFTGGNVGIGTNSPSQRLSVDGNVTISDNIALGGSSIASNRYINVDTDESSSFTTYSSSFYRTTTGSGSLEGISSLLVNRGSSTLAVSRAGDFRVSNETASGGISNAYGVHASAFAQLGGDIDKGYGVYSSVYPTETSVIGTASAGYFILNSWGQGSIDDGLILSSRAAFYGTGVVDNLYGLSMSNWVSNGTVNNSYGIYIDSTVDIGTNSWAIYSDTSSDSYISGYVGLGITNPSARLSLVGSGVSNGILFGNDIELYRPVSGYLQTNGFFGAFSFQSSFAGSAFFPAYGFTTDSNTGIYLPAADTLGVSVGGSEAFRVNNARHLGIGITSPNYRLDVANGTGVVGRFSGRVIGGEAVNSNEFVTKSQLDLVSSSIFWNRSGSYTYLSNTADFVGIGTASPAAKLTVAGDGSILAQGAYGAGWDGLSSDGVTELGSGTRLMWIPSKGAFRAGRINGAGWDTSYVGDNSVVLGFDSIASGISSVAFGEANDATGDYSTVLGYNSTASGTISTSIGFNNQSTGLGSLSLGYESTSVGWYSIAAGYYAHAGSFHEISLGRYPESVSGSPSVFAGTDVLFEIGNGVDNASRSNALTILKNGRLGVGTSTPVSAIHLMLDSAGMFSYNGFSTGLIIEDDELASLTLLSGNVDTSRILFGYPNDNDAGSIRYSNEFDRFNIGTSSNHFQLTLESNGNLGVGAASPSARLDVLGTTELNGDVSIVGGILNLNTLALAGGAPLCLNGNDVALCSSSIRYKNSVATYSGGLDAVMQLRPVSYRWNTDGTEDLGLIAEEVVQVEPRLGIYYKGRLEGVKYSQLTAVLVQAIQEQQAQIDSLSGGGASYWNLSGAELSTVNTVNANAFVNANSSFVADALGNVKASNIVVTNTISGVGGVLNISGSVRADEVVAKKFQVDLSDPASASLGSASIVTGESEVRVDSTSIAAGSKVFITARSSLEGHNLYVSEVADGYFIVRISTPVGAQVDFDWWVVN